LEEKSREELIRVGLIHARNISTLTKRIIAAKDALANKPLASKEERLPLSLQIHAWESDRPLFQRKLWELDQVEIPRDAGMNCNENVVVFPGGKGYDAFVETAQIEEMGQHRYRQRMKLQRDLRAAQVRSTPWRVVERRQVDRWHEATLSSSRERKPLNLRQKQQLLRQLKRL